VSRTARETTTTYAAPYRPPVVRAANLVGSALAALGARPDLSAESLLRSARRRTGLEDFGDPSFREPLEVLVDSVEREAGLTPVGRLITRERLVGALGNRLRAERLFREHPQILDQRLEPPVVITGLQRTGTTFLHRLLAADPGLRALASWEAINPAPFLRPGADGEDPRIRQARRSERALAFLAPDFFAIHPVEAEAPEEDVLLLDYAFLSTVPEATLRVPTYARWLESRDQTPAYRYMVRLLKLLQWRRSGERWVLKSPHHLEYLDTLLAVFPDARIIQTHRDPVTTVASFCSMIAHGRGVFSDRVDPVEVGRDWLRKTARMISRGMEVRARARDGGAVAYGACGGGTFFDVRYEDLLRRPMEVIEEVYGFLGRPLGGRTREAVERARRENVQHRYGSHRYRLADFGLSPGDVRRSYGAYCEAFGFGDAAGGGCESRRRG